MRESKLGPVIDLESGQLERLAAIAVIRERVPLCGKEVKFLRKVLGLSLEKFSAKLGLSSGTVFHWEKAARERLAPVNEAALRTLMAEELEVDLPAKFSLLLGIKIQKLEVRAS
jgi:DNA-binding transcriptional regulator YiaG